MSPPTVGARVIERGDDKYQSLIGVVARVDDGIRSSPSELYVLVDWEEDGYVFAEWRSWDDLVLVDR